MSVLASLLPISAAINAAANLLRSRPQGPSTATGDSFQKTLGQLLVERWDADGDGVLSIGEFGGKAEAFRRFDRDGNGALTVGELDAGLAEIRREQQLQAAVQRAMETRDANRDGLLTRTEFGLGSDEFNQFDANGDRFVSRSEMLAAYNRQAQ